ncbi:est [Symbiodinium sp. CCMP2592]|nr:est [Symbiodinium sp. CCMP2592]
MARPYLLLALLAASLAAAAKPNLWRGRRKGRRGPEAAGFPSSFLSEASAQSDGGDQCRGPGHSDLHLLAAATACCYGRIVHNTSCCMDENIATGVSRKEVQRPGMSWDCNDENCYDTLVGKRGADVLWFPDGADCSTPRILYTHGGSWMFGSPDTDSYAQLASKLSKATGAVVMLTDYPLVPAGNYTSILQWSIAALQWLEVNGPVEGCGKERPPLFVGGDSSGGGTTMSLVLTLKQTPHLLKRPLDGAFFYSPWTNLMCNTPEYYTNAFSRIENSGRFKDHTQLQMYTGDILFQQITPENADAFEGNAVEYLGGLDELQTDPIASSFFAEPQDFTGDVPPLFFSVGASESILGDSVHVAQTAAQAGVDVILDVYHAMWHVFPMYSEGCGSGTELWQGAYAINKTGLFVRHIAETGRLPYKVTIEGPKGGPPQSSILARFWEPGTSKLPAFQYLYDPNIKKFEKVGELMPNTDAAYSYKDLMKTLAHSSPWVVLPSITGTRDCFVWDLGKNLGLGWYSNFYAFLKMYMCCLNPPQHLLFLGHMCLEVI